MTKRFIFILLCLICLGACKSPTPKITAEDIVIIDVDKAISTSGEINLSDIADSVSIVPVLDGNNAYIGSMLSFTEMTRNYLLTCDAQGRLVCYNVKNKKSRQIGARGRGPKEYLYIRAITADEPNNVIYALVDLAAQSAIFKYNFEGDFLGSIPLDESGDNIGLTNDGYLVVHIKNFSGNSKSQYIVIDGDSKLLTDFPQPFSYSLLERKAYFPQNSIKYTYDGDLHMKDHSDTLYVFRGKERYPKYVFKNVWSIDGKKGLTHTEYDNVLVLTDVLETNKKLIFYARRGVPGIPENPVTWYQFCYDKTTRQTFLFEGDIRNNLTSVYPKDVRIRSESGAEFGDFYGLLRPNLLLTEPGYPQDEDASYFMVLLHLR